MSPFGESLPVRGPSTNKLVAAPFQTRDPPLSLSYLQIVANGGNTQPKLFNGAILASPFEPPNYYYNASIPQVGLISRRAVILV
jgi:hypothetical protein